MADNLPTLSNEQKAYELVLVHGRIAYVSGQVSRADDRVITGHLRKDDDIGEAQEAARVSVRRCLAALKHKLGSLDKIEQVLTVRGFVSAAPDFERHPEVINAASELLIEYLGERGRHARFALGVSSIPAGGLTEIEMSVAIA